MKYPKAVINTKTLQHNISLIQDQNPDANIIALVNSNAYGHGIVEIARALENTVNSFATTRLDEAETLRDNGVTSPIIVTQGFINLVELFKIIDLKVQVVISNLAQLELIKQYQEHLSGLKIWLYLNQGGLSPDDLIEAYMSIKTIKAIKSLGLMVDEFNEQAQSVIEAYPFNDIAIMDNKKKYDLDTNAQIWISSGVQLYGLQASDYNVNNLISVMNLETTIVQIHHRKAGDKIGYGSIYTVPKDTYIGVIAMGYGDGYPRNAPTGTPVLVNRRIVPIVGRVSMDMLTVDLGEELIDKVGDKVYIWGDKLKIEDVASKLGISDYQLTSYLTERVKHEFN